MRWLVLLLAPAALAGGYTLGTPVPTAYRAGTDTGMNIQPEVPVFRQAPANPADFLNSTTLSNSFNAFITRAGDPLNMATGNLVHSERDLTIKGRGGLPLVFARSYNSRSPVDGPLGYG